MNGWRGQKLILQLHHLNGDNLDNREENLQVLCPNCHSLTENWAGRIRKVKAIEKTKAIKKCPHCDKNFLPNSRVQKYCSNTCSNKFNARHIIRERKVENRPSKDELLKMVEETNFSAVGRKFGVSDNAVRKWLK